MGRYILRRLMMVPLLLLGVTTVTFIIVHLAPGSPLDDLRVTVPGITDEDLDRIARSLGLNEPIWRQYVNWISDVARGDLGLSLQNARPVRDQILERLPNTLLLTGLSMGIALLIAIPVGVIAAVRRNSLFDQIATIVSAIGAAVPSFWIGLLLILMFSVQASRWGWYAMPSSGMRPVTGDVTLWDRVQYLILPVTALAIGQVADTMRFVRAQMLEVLRLDYIRTARSKGMRERQVIVRHAFRNALLPLVTLIGLSLPQLIAGAAIVETIFSWPGLGQLTVSAANRHDYTMIMGTTIFIGLVTLLSTLLTDLVYAVIDPRITYK